MKKRVLVILGHPRADSFCGVLADTYTRAATESGAEVRRVDVSALDFDPLGVKGENHAPPPESDILSVQSDIRWAQHLVFVYPIWWGTVPALLKGFLERTFAAGFAIEFPERPPYDAPLLKGRSARLITTMNTPPLIYRWLLRAPGHNVMKHAVLQLCGIKPVRVTAFGPIKSSTPASREKWIAKVRALGRRRR